MDSFKNLKKGSSNVIVTGFQLDFEDSCRLPLFLGQNNIFAVDPTETIVDMIDHRKNHTIEIPPKQPPLYHQQPQQVFLFSCSTPKAAPPADLSRLDPDYYPEQVVIKP